MAALLLIGAALLLLVALDRPRARPAPRHDGLIAKLTRLDF